MENALLLQKLSLTVRRKRRPYLEMPCLIDLLETSLKDCADCWEKVSAL